MTSETLSVMEEKVSILRVVYLLEQDERDMFRLKKCDNSATTIHKLE